MADSSRRSNPSDDAVAAAPQQAHQGPIFRTRPGTVALAATSPACVSQRTWLEGVDYDDLWDAFQNGDIGY